MSEEPRRTVHGEELPDVPEVRVRILWANAWRCPVCNVENISTRPVDRTLAVCTNCDSEAILVR